MKVLSKIAGGISAILKVICIIIMLEFTIMLSYQVLGRYLFHVGLPWLDELLRFSMVWLVYLCSSYIIINSEHIKMSVIEDTFLKKPIPRKVSHTIQYVVMIIFSVLMIRYGVNIVLTNNNIAQALPIALSTAYMILPIAGVLNIFACIFRLITEWAPPEGGEALLEGGEAS